MLVLTTFWRKPFRFQNLSMRNSKTSAPDDPSDHEHNRSFAINTNKSINRVKISLMHRFHLRTMRSRPSNPRHALPSWKTRRPKKRISGTLLLRHTRRVRKPRANKFERKRNGIIQYGKDDEENSKRMSWRHAPFYFFYVIPIFLL